MRILWVAALSWLGLRRENGFLYVLLVTHDGKCGKKNLRQFQRFKIFNLSCTIGRHIVDVPLSSTFDTRYRYQVVVDADSDKP